jgi:hypothetical protein
MTSSSGNVNLQITVMNYKEQIPADHPIQPFDPAEFPLARRRGTAGRTEVRTTTHRVMGSRQSEKEPEHSRQRRQPKTGGTGNRYRQPRKGR